MAPVTVRLSDGVISVADAGPGIAEADLPFVFDRFYRSEESRTMPGSGLGLAIVRQAAERHGGTVTADRAPQGGALMRLRLPHSSSVTHTGPLILLTGDLGILGVWMTPTPPIPPDSNNPWGTQPPQPPESAPGENPPKAGGEPGASHEPPPPEAAAHPPYQQPTPEPPPYDYGSHGSTGSPSYQSAYEAGYAGDTGFGQSAYSPTPDYGAAPYGTSAYGTGATAPFPGLPLPSPRSRTSAGSKTLVAIALVALLVGGGIGGAVGYHAANSSSSHVISSLGPPAGSSNIEPGGGNIQQVAAKVLPSVVSIDVSNLPSNTSGSVIPGFPGFGSQGNGSGGSGSGSGSGSSSDTVEGSGSGVVIGKDGLILTNNHVAGQGDLAVTFQNGKTVKATLVKADPVTDLAVIKADGVTDATPISFGRSAELSVGQQVVAIGSPLGLSGTVTSGIISALHRPIQPQEDTQGSGTANANSEANVIDGVQTDAPINPGNSGGALVDMNGNLIGITSAIATLGGGPFGGQSGSIGLGFAIPADEAKLAADQLAKGEAVAHALLGVQVSSSPNLLQRGALIKSITAGGPADKAGLKKGDLVIKADDRIIDTSDALVADVRSHQPGDKVTLTYIRGNATQTVDVSLGSEASTGH